MSNLTNRQRHQFIIILVILLLTAYQLSRLIAFINVHGGLEHDGGWMLSISRSLAEQGAYTTMVSTLSDPEAGAGLGVDQKFDIQAADGRIWFFTGNGIGPASIIPDALVLKIFGTGFWSLRLGPLLFYLLFLLLAAYSLYRLAGLGAVLLFHAFLFFYPHLSIFLGYEAMGEVPSMVYIVGAYLAFASATQRRRRRALAFFLAGLVAGLALNAKVITLWSLSGLFIWAGLLWLEGRRSAPAGRLKGSELLWLGSGLPLTLGLWELVHGVVLTRLTSFELYLRHLQQRIDFILDDGSGVGLRTHSGPEFFWDKFFTLTEVAHPQRWVTALIFVALLLGGGWLLWHWRNQPARRNLFAPMWLGWLVNTVWFVGLAKTGWPRHFWFGLVLAVLLLSVIGATLLTEGFKELNQSAAGGARLWLPLAAGLLLLGLIGWGFARQPHVRGFFVPAEIVPYWQQRQIEHKYGASLPWIIIPRRAQAEVVAYLRKLPPEASIYYPAQHKAAEIPVQVGRVIYPVARRQFMTRHPQDVALISPSLIAPWMAPARREALLERVRDDCPQPLLANDYYMICPFPAE